MTRAETLTGLTEAIAGHAPIIRRDAPLPIGCRCILRRQCRTQEGRVLTEAIFALAYEQRTANLIAFLDGTDKPLTPGDGPRELYNMIVKRLGLQDEGETDE